MVYGLERKPTYLNQRLIQILNYPQRGIRPDLTAGRNLEQAHKHFSFRVIGSDREYPLEHLPVSQAFEGVTASADDIEVDLINRRVPLEIWASPVRDDHGQIESVVSAVLDITQRKKDEAELNEYRQHLEMMVDDRTAQLSIINEVLQTEIAERERLQAELHMRLEWLMAVNSANQTVIRKADLPQIYQNFCAIIPKLFGAEEAFVAEHEADSPDFILRAHSTEENTHPDWIQVLISLPPAILSYPFFERGEFEIFSREQLSSLSRQLSAYIQATESQFFLLAPLRFQERLVGLLGLEYLDAEPSFSDSQTALLQKICFDIAQIEEKAHMYERTRDLVATEERSRLARDLHNSVTQVLFAASLVAEVLPQIWRRDPNQALVSLEELRRLTRVAMAEMRTMLLELRPSGVIKTPLSDLLAQLTEAITGRASLPFQLFIEQIPALPEDVHICFYRIAQESLNNVIKHASASRVEVSLSANPLHSDRMDTEQYEVKLMVRDNGRGLIAQKDGSPHLGLSIMRERAEAIHATLSVEGQPGAGTTVTLTWLADFMRKTV